MYLYDKRKNKLINGFPKLKHEGWFPCYNYDRYDDPDFGSELRHKHRDRNKKRHHRKNKEEDEHLIDIDGKLDKLRKESENYMKSPNKSKGHSNNFDDRDKKHG